MRLYHAPLSSNARRVTMLAEHLGIPLDLVEVNLMSQEDRRRLVELNPNSKLPVLEDGQFLLWESCAIMQYLTDKTPAQQLYPANLQVRADVNRWMFWSVQHFSPAIGILVWEKVWKGITGNGAADPVMLARGERELAQFGAVLDAQLATRTWVLGERLTLADFALVAPLMYHERASLPLEQFPHLVAWFERFQALEAWKHTDVSWSIPE